MLAMQNEKQAVLKGLGTLTWAWFTRKSPDTVEVVAIEGAVFYTDRTLPRAEAIAKYRKLQAQGWTAADPVTAMPISTLRLHIYD